MQKCPIVGAFRGRNTRDLGAWGSLWGTFLACVECHTAYPQLPELTQFVAAPDARASRQIRQFWDAPVLAT